MVDTKTDIDQNLLYGSRASLLSPPDCPFNVRISTNKTKKQKQNDFHKDLIINQRFLKHGGGVTHY